MRFASIGSANAGSYASAGAQVANSAARVFDVQRKTGPDYAGLSKVAMNTQSNEKVTAMRTAAQVTKEGINQLKNKTQMQHALAVYDNKKDIFNSKRKAGGIAAIGKVGAAAVLSRDNTKDREYPTSNFDEMYKAYKAKKDAITTKYDSDVDALGDAPSSNGVSSSSTSGDGAGKATTGVSSSQGTGSKGTSNTAMRYMETLTKSGMSETQAAALVGHLKVESDNFQADTEYAPNAYGTRGRGHLQWTDTGNSGGRRTNFEAFANSNNLDPTSFEANSQFLLSEMSGKHGNHWTGGGSLAGFKSTNNLNSASSYLQTNYIRPGVPHTERRLQGANEVLSQWRNR